MSDDEVKAIYKSALKAMLVSLWLLVAIVILSPLFILISLMALLGLGIGWINPYARRRTAEKLWKAQFNATRVFARKMAGGMIP